MSRAGRRPLSRAPARLRQETRRSAAGQAKRAGQVLVVFGAALSAPLYHFLGIGLVV